MLLLIKCITVIWFLNRSSHSAVNSFRMTFQFYSFFSFQHPAQGFVYCRQSIHIFDEWILLLNKLSELHNRMVVLLLLSLFKSPGCLNFYAANIVFNLELEPQSLLHALSKGCWRMRLNYELDLGHCIKFACLLPGLLIYHLSPR